MRGHPLRECLLFLAAWSLLVIPVIRLTGGPDAQRATIAAEGKADTTTALAAARWTVPPRHFLVEQHGKPLWTLDDVTSPTAETAMEVLLEDGVVELAVQADWTDDAPAPRVVEISLSPEQLSQRTVHVWVDQTLDDVLVFDWHEEHHHE